MRRLISILCILTLFIGITGCEELTPQKELALGAEEHGKIEKEMGNLYPDPQVQQYVQTIGAKLAPFAHRPDMVWQYRVVSSDEINAFALPGGYIYVTKGLLERLHTEAQLAGVLAHETSHIEHRDSAHQIERQQATNIFGAVAGVAGAAAGVGEAGTVASAVGQLSMLSYSRDQEKNADLEGLHIMTQAGYNPQGLEQAMKIIKTSSKGGRAPSFLSSHPDPGDRVKYIQKTIDEKYAGAAQTGKIGEQEFAENVTSRLH